MTLNDQDWGSLEVATADPAAPESMALIEKLWFELGGLYGNLGPCEFRPEDIAGPRNAFVVARLDGQAVGCGALISHEGETAEVKRMFVLPEARRFGVAREILEFLEKTAAGLGYRVARLETGILQEGAIRLYESAGYVSIPCWGSYACDPQSRCFEKTLRL